MSYYVHIYISLTAYAFRNEVLKRPTVLCKGAFLLLNKGKDKHLKVANKQTPTQIIGPSAINEENKDQDT